MNERLNEWTDEIIMIVVIFFISFCKEPLLSRLRLALDRFFFQ